MTKSPKYAIISYQNKKGGRKNMFIAKLNDSKLNAKNINEMFTELHKYFNFENLQNLKSTLDGLNTRLYIQL